MEEKKTTMEEEGNQLPTMEEEGNQQSIERGESNQPILNWEDEVELISLAFISVPLYKYLAETREIPDNLQSYLLMMNNIKNDHKKVFYYS